MNSETSFECILLRMFKQKQVVLRQIKDMFTYSNIK